MKVNQLRAGAILSYISLFFNIVVGLLYTPIMLRLMGQTEYGLFSLTISIVGYLTILDLGFGNAIIRYIAKYRALNQKDQEHSLFGMFLTIYTVIGILAAAIGFIMYLFAGTMFHTTMTPVQIEKIKIMLLLLTFNIAISFPLGVFGSIITAYERFVFGKIVNIIRIILSPCIMLPILFLGYRAIGMVVISTILNLSCLLVNVIYCFTKIKIKIVFEKFDLTLLKEIFAFSFWMFVIIIVDRIYWSSDQFILGMVSGSVMVAIYAIAAQFYNYYISFSNALSGVFLPRLTKLIAKNASESEISDLFIKTGRIEYIILSFILSGFLIYGREFIKHWAGSDYSGAYLMAIIIMIPLTVPLIQALGPIILQAKNMMAFRSIVYFIVAIINIVLSVILSKHWGGVGCSIGTAFAMITGNIIAMNIYYYKRVHLDIPRFWREIALLTIPIVITVIIGICFNSFIPSNHFYMLFIKILMFSLVFCILMWFFGMNKYEQDIFAVPVKKVFKKLNIFGE